VTDRDRERLGIAGNGTRVAIIIESSQVRIAQFSALTESLANNIYLRDVLGRRHMEMAHLRDGVEIERSGRISFEEPPSLLLLGPDLRANSTATARPLPSPDTQARAGRATGAARRRAHQRPAGAFRHGGAGLPAVRLREPGRHRIPVRHRPLPGAQRAARPGCRGDQRRTRRAEPEDTTWWRHSPGRSAS